MTVLKAPESNRTYYVKESVLIVDCATCSIAFGIPTAFEKRRRRDHEAFYCPNGHANVYGGATADEKAAAQNKQQLADTKRQLARERDRSGRLAAQRDQARAEKRAEKAAKTRIKNARDRERARVGNGVCPACNRSFANLKQHMACKHPDHGRPEA